MLFAGMVNGLPCLMQLWGPQKFGAPANSCTLSASKHWFYMERVAEKLARLTGVAEQYCIAKKAKNSPMMCVQECGAFAQRECALNGYLNILKHWVAHNYSSRWQLQSFFLTLVFGLRVCFRRQTLAPLLFIEGYTVVTFLIGYFRIGLKVRAFVPEWTFHNNLLTA